MSIISRGFGGGFLPGVEIEVKIETSGVSAFTEDAVTAISTTTQTVMVKSQKTKYFPTDEAEEDLNTEC